MKQCLLNEYKAAMHIKVHIFMQHYRSTENKAMPFK